MATQKGQVTKAEINQQPQMWFETLIQFKEKREEIVSFLEKADIKNGRILLCGAGSSEFIGQSLVNILRRELDTDVIVAPITSFVTNPDEYISKTKNLLVFSFARSGNSPESVATYNMLKQLTPNAKHIVITCNEKGKLAIAAQKDENSYLWLLPKETNDKSLVMTSSFSSMVCAGLCIAYHKNMNFLEKALKTTIDSTKNFLENKDYINLLENSANEKNINRIQFLGTGALEGMYYEPALKILEMTSGLCASKKDSFLGLRHGPQVFVDDNALIIASISNNSYNRLYETDLLKELQTKEQGRFYLLIHNEDIDLKLEKAKFIKLDSTNPIDDNFRILSDLVIGQIFGYFKSLSYDLDPDNPSISGIINRVVQGVTIYPYKK